MNIARLLAQAFCQREITWMIHHKHSRKFCSFWWQKVTIFLKFSAMSYDRKHQTQEMYINWTQTLSVAWVSIYHRFFFFNPFFKCYSTFFSMTFILLCNLHYTQVSHIRYWLWDLGCFMSQGVQPWGIAQCTALSEQGSCLCLFLRVHYLVPTELSTVNGYNTGSEWWAFTSGSDSTLNAVFVTWSPNNLETFWTTNGDIQNFAFYFLSGYRISKQ